jgi:signal transduction histidine kinase
MKTTHRKVEDRIAEVPESAWKVELEKTSVRYHVVAAWIAIIFNPIFAITDYINIPADWQTIFYLRCTVAAVTLVTLLLYKKSGWPSRILVLIPFLLISIQNAITYKFIGTEDILGHNLNYMALFIGAGFFVGWKWAYSLITIIVSVVASVIFITLNPVIELRLFLLNGGLLLLAVGAFMFVLIKTRYDLTVKEIKARIALKLSNQEILEQNEEIQAQNEEIQAQAKNIQKINNNLEHIVHLRTIDLEKKNKALEEYAFINAHKLRSPVASILGLVNLISKTNLDDEGQIIVNHLERSTVQLDTIVGSITKTIERAE